MTTSARLDSVVVALIHSMPPDQIAKLWYALVDWLANRAARMESRGLGEFDTVWDKVVDAAELHPSGYNQKPGRDWSFESLNSVVGRLVLALMDVRLPDGQNAVPAKWISRLTKVLKLPGDHGRHALHLAAQRTSWLHYHEPAWTDAHVLSKATDGGPDGDAFWSGFARMGHVPDPALIKQLKTSMLERVSGGGREEHNLIGYLLSGWGIEGPRQIVSDAELRDVLVLSDNDVRHTVLRFVGEWASKHQQWQDFVLPFIAKVWPKQRRLETPQMSSALVRFASGFPSQFATILNIISRRLVTLSREHSVHLDCAVTDLDDDGIEALLIALEKLLPEDRAEWPYDGKQIIDALVAADRGRGQRLDDLIRRAAEREY